METMNNTDLRLAHEFDAKLAKDLEQEFDALSMTEKEEVTLDLSQCRFIDSCGIGAIVFLYKRLKSRGRTLRLLNVNGQPRELLVMLRIDKVIPLITSAEM
uniref:STAS domain-containing protein n=1 Tax=Thaumasiovibrio occultus TaxID=1891184 RepID=UPI000B35FB0E|nr:STAS domain-containing protein [Thaumasiovibrio occultus]